MTLQQKLKKIGDALVAGLTVYAEGDETGHLACGVYHYWRPKLNPPYCVWAEDGEQSPAANADNRKVEQAVTGFVDYYTKTEFDTNLDTIQAVLRDLQEDETLGWRLDSVQYEDDTNLIHYQWTWVIA